MNKIHSICLNTSIDNIIEVDHFKKGMITNANKSFLYPSGKAINSARTIACLKEYVNVLGFVGKGEVSFFRKLRSKFLKINLTPVKGATRRNITLTDSSHKLVTHVRIPGYDLNKNDVDSLTSEIKSLLSHGDAVIISGSIPEGLPPDTYNKIISVCNSKSSKVILDTSGIFLKKAIEAKPFAIKPNLEELQELLGKKIKSESDIVVAAKELNGKGIELVLISNGAKGVILTRKNTQGYWKANLKITTGFKSDEIGCGDAMVGGIAVAVKNKLDIEGLLTLSISCGAANLLTSGPGVCYRNDILNLSKIAKVYYKARRFS